MTRFAWVLLAGCGRVGFDAVGDGGLVGEANIARPWDGNFTLTAPVPVSAINSSTFETECYVTADEKSMYFASDRNGQLHDVFVSTRTEVGAPFSAASRVSEISTAAAEGRFATPDGLTAYFWSDRNGSTGPTDIWVVTRSSQTVAFSNANAMPVPVVSTGATEYDPWPSHDGLRLYFSRIVGGTTQDLFVASRDAPTAPFQTPVVLSELSSPSNEDNIAVSADHRFVVFGSNRPGGVGQMDIYFARRANVDATFDAPQLLPVVNSSADETEACITESGELFFSSNRAGGAGSNDIYQARFVPQ